MDETPQLRVLGHEVAVELSCYRAGRAELLKLEASKMLMLHRMYACSTFLFVRDLKVQFRNLSNSRSHCELFQVSLLSLR